VRVIQLIDRSHGRARRDAQALEFLCDQPALVPDIPTILDDDHRRPGKARTELKPHSENGQGDNQRGERARE